MKRRILLKEIETTADVVIAAGETVTPGGGGWLAAPRRGRGSRFLNWTDFKS